MKITKIEIWNFRGLNKTIEGLGVKNILTGPNGVGKSNILFVLNKIFDRKERKKPLLEEDSNLHNKKNIILSAEFEWENSNDFFSDNIETSHTFQAPSEGFLRYKITLLFIYDKELYEYVMHVIIGDVPLNKIEQIKEFADIDTTLEKQDYVQKYPNQKLDIDSIFNVVYIAPWNKLKEISEVYIKNYINNKKEEGPEISEHFLKLTENINQNISDIMQGAISEDISNAISKIDSNKNVKLASKFQITSMHKSMKINLGKKHSDQEGTQTLEVKGSDGEERLISFLANKANFNDDLFSIILVEEPENHMHIGLQRNFLNIIFSGGQQGREVLFATTHSPTIVDAVYKESNIFNIQEGNTNHNGFKIDGDVERFIYQTNINKILFSDKVIFVEGHSEEYFLRWFIKNNIAFNTKYSNVEIINVHGVNFFPFVKLCIKNNIKYQIFTDNDIFGTPTKKYAGLKRAYKLAMINIDLKSGIPTIFSELEEANWELSEIMSQKIIDSENQIFEWLKKEHIYLQKSKYIKTITLEDEYIEYEIFNEQEVNSIQNEGKLKKLVDLLSQKKQECKLISGSDKDFAFPLLRALWDD